MKTVRELLAHVKGPDRQGPGPVYDDDWFYRKYGSWAWYFKEHAKEYNIPNKYMPDGGIIDDVDAGELHIQSQEQDKNKIEMGEYNPNCPTSIKKRVKRFYRLRLREMSEVVIMRDDYYVRYGIQGPRPKSRLDPFFAVIYVLGKMFGTDTDKFEIQGVKVCEMLDEYIVEITLSNPGLLIGTMGRTLDSLMEELTKVFDKKCKVKIVEAKGSFLSRQVIKLEEYD